MATFTITTDSDMDSLTTKTGGDTYNVNGATLTINSDSRWAKNASATIGPHGPITISSTLGGNVTIDGTQVWWIAYDGGVDNVPAAGTTITGDTSGATGELIGVWSALNTTPTTAGSAMPTTGFIKLKSKLGTFQDNENLSESSVVKGVVNSTTGGVRGWLEIVGDEAQTCTVPRLGRFEINGDWFEVDATDGTAGQIIQLPNPGGTNTFYPGVWIETGVASGVFEHYPAVLGTGTTPWTTANMGTDARAKFVQALDSGRIRIGSDGTNNIGFVPASGCRVRIPNVILMNTTSANRSVNVVPNATLATRYDFTTTSAGDIDLENCIGSWHLSFAQPYGVRMHYVSTFDQVVISECATQIDMLEANNGNYTQSDGLALSMTSNFAGVSMVDCKFGRSGTIAASDHSCTISNCIGVDIDGGIFGGRTLRTAITAYAINFSQCLDTTLTDVTNVNGSIAFTTCTNATLTNTVYCDRYSGTTTTTAGTGTYAIQGLTFSSNITVDGLTFFSGVSNVHPYLGLFSITNQQGFLAKNIGTYASPLNLGSANASGLIIVSAGNSSDVTLKRVYTTNNRTGLCTFLNSDTGVLFENVMGDYTDTQAAVALNMQMKGCAFTNSVTGQTAVYGTHFLDGHTSTTTGRLVLALNEKTSESPSATTYTINSGTPRFTSTGSLIMPSLTDEITFEMPYYAIGYTAFTNTAPTITGTSTGNLTLTYDIDINDGNGFTGSYQTLNAANLSAETIDPVLGFKLRIKVAVNTASTATLLTYIRISMDSTTTTQAYQYPLNLYTLTFTGLQTGTKIAIVEDGTETLVETLTESGGTASFTYDETQVGDIVDFNILAPEYLYQKLSGTTLTAADTSIPVSQVVDYGYDAATSATVTFDGSTKVITMDPGELELNVVGMYSDYVDWALTADNLRYDFAFAEAGGNVIDSGAGTSIPVYAFLTNGWRIAPDEANYTLAVTSGIVLVDGGGDPFLDTVGAYTVRINYQQPVQAITVSTGGGGGATAAQVWSYATRELSTTGNEAVSDAVWDEATADHLTAGTTGKKLNDDLTTIKFIALK